MMQVRPRYGLRSEKGWPRPAAPICTDGAEVVTGALNGASVVVAEEVLYNSPGRLLALIGPRIVVGLGIAPSPVVVDVAGIEIETVPVPPPEVDAVWVCAGSWVFVSWADSVPPLSPGAIGESPKPVPLPTGLRPCRSGNWKLVVPLPPYVTPSSANSAWFCVIEIVWPWHNAQP